MMRGASIGYTVSSVRGSPRVMTTNAATVRIQYRLTPPFPVDLVVRTPEQLARRLAQGESFLTTVVPQGKVLYEKDDARVGPA
jgi:hypothetical protein